MQYESEEMGYKIQTYFIHKLLASYLMPSTYVQSLHEALWIAILLEAFNPFWTLFWTILRVSFVSHAAVNNCLDINRKQELLIM